MRVGALTDGHNQVLPEFKGFQPLWMADHDCYSGDTTLDEWADILEAKEMEQSCIRRFLELEEGGRLTNPQLHRRSTYWLLMALGNALDVMTGRGFEGWPRGPKLFFTIIHDSAKALVQSHRKDLPRARSMVADQASNGLTATAFLQHV